jgi:hypothetical protein
MNRWGDRISFPDDDNTTLLTLYLEVSAALFGQLYRVHEDVQKHLLNMLRLIIDSYPGYRAWAVCIVPAAKAPANWHEQALAWLRGEGVNNQGRVRSDNIAARQYDGLLFRTDEEINLYRAFKAQGNFCAITCFCTRGQPLEAYRTGLYCYHRRNGGIIEIYISWFTLGGHEMETTAAHPFAT